MELDASLPMIHVFQLRCRLSIEPITIMVDYEWIPIAFEICKVIGHLCKALVEVPTMLVEDMFKTKKK